MDTNKTGHVRIRMVKTGIENRTEVEILPGIKQGDFVVTSRVYLLNSTFVLKNGAGLMGGMKM